MVQPDFEYALSKAKVLFHLLSPCIQGDTHDEALCDIFCEPLMFEQNEQCYDADLAQLNVHLRRSFAPTGLQLSLGGFSHKLLDMVFLVFEHLLNFQP